MQCRHMKSTIALDQAHTGCCCEEQKMQDRAHLSREKRIMYLEAHLRCLNDQKTDLEELIRELKDKE